MISRDEHGLAVTEYSHHFKSGSELMRKAMAHFSDKKLTWTYDQQDGSLVAHNTIERFKVVGRVVNTWIPLHGNALTLAVSVSRINSSRTFDPFLNRSRRSRNKTLLLLGELIRSAMCFTNRHERMITTYSSARPPRNG